VIVLSDEDAKIVMDALIHGASLCQDLPYNKTEHLGRTPPLDLLMDQAVGIMSDVLQINEDWECAHKFTWQPGVFRERMAEREKAK